MYETMILPLWGYLDQLYYVCNRLQFVDRHTNNIFRVKATRYQGYPLLLRDGLELKRGDLVLKIHLHNYGLMRKMMNMESEVRKALFVHDLVKQSLPGLAKYISDHPLESEIKGVLGVTVLNRGTARLGFDSFELHNILYHYWKRSYMIPMTVLCNHKRGTWAVRKLDPKYLVMSKNIMMDLYG